MAKIIKMEMRGFKSFAGKTEVVFGDDFNCIIGPNGSGKSNIIDSLCYVLGKSSAKGLRADKSANLIYNGGKTKKPASEASVSLWFDNEGKEFSIDTQTVKITRTIKSTGISKYQVNDQTVTRAQMLDLLASARINPDGYNIILQGDIIKLCEMSPNERRGIIEEVAGISVYEEKKQKAIRELEKVDTQIRESEIILSERETYLKELKKERDQAVKFKELDEKLKRNKATLLHKKLTEKSKKEEELVVKIKKEQESIEKLKKEIDTNKKKIDEQKQAIQEVTQEIERRGEKEQVKLHKQVEQLKVDLALKEQRVEVVTGEIEKVKTRIQELKKTHADTLNKVSLFKKEKIANEKAIKTKERELEIVSKKIEAFKKKHNMENVGNLDERMAQIDTEADKINEQIQKQREQQQSLLREKDQLEYKLETIDQKIEKVLSITKENKGQIEVLKNNKTQFKKLALDLSKEINNNSSYAAELSMTRSKLLTKKEELAKYEARKMSIREAAAGNIAVTKILDQKKKIQGIHGLVSELGKVSQKYSLALEIAAGAKIKSIVVENDAVAAKCIKYLKDNKLGVATFLPLNKIRPILISAEIKAMKGNGIHGLALDLIKYDKRYDAIFKYVFGSSIVVEDITTARKIGIGKAKMVTLTGDVTETSGAMRGGHRARKSGMGAGFAQKEVEENIEKLEKECADLQTIVSHREKDKIKSEKMIEKMRKMKADLEADIIKMEKTLHLDSDDLKLDKEEKKKLAKELKDIDKKIDTVSDEVSIKNRDLAKLKIEKQQLRDKIMAQRSPAVIAEMNTFEQSKSRIEKEVIELTTENKNIGSQIGNIFGPEQESTLKIIKQHEKEIETFKQEQITAAKMIKGYKQELKEKEAQESKFYAQFKELFNKRNKAAEAMQKIEAKVIQLEENIRKTEHKSNAISLEKATVSAELAGIKEEYKDYEGVSLFRDKEVSVMQSEIRQFEKMLENLGAINMKALDMYDRIKKEYDALTEKKTTLTDERKDVLLLITKIDGKKKELFMKTYDIINKNFQKIFLSLSTKGECSLHLENENNPFEGGLTLRVRLSGKKFLDIRSLSGGEKTLTALAFLFAVQEHEPASFYILDEVDAALDKRNAEMLAKLIRGYCDRAQYIVISHNSGVITEGDNIYGISMDEHGVTKVTTLKV